MEMEILNSHIFWTQECEESLQETEAKLKFSSTQSVPSTLIKCIALNDEVLSGLFKEKFRL